MNYFDVLFAKKQSGGGGTPTLITKTITKNGTYNASSDNADGYSQVTANIPLGTKTITANGVYNASDDDLAGYSSVAVNVSDTLADSIIEGSATSITSNAGSVRENCFYHYANLTSVNLPSATNIGAYAFYNCANLTSVNLPSATNIGAYAFQATKLTSIVLPSMTSIETKTFYYTTKLETIDLPSATEISENVFNGSAKLNTIILRKNQVCTLANINTFENTPFAWGKAGGTLYVPRDLISSYQNATNWSVILGYEDNQIKAIEDM